MKMRTGSLSGVIFLTLVAIAHLSRFVTGTEVTIGGIIVPQWVSVAGVIVPGLIALLLLKESK